MEDNQPLFPAIYFQLFTNNDTHFSKKTKNHLQSLLLYYWMLLPLKLLLSSVILVY